MVVRWYLILDAQDSKIVFHWIYLWHDWILAIEVFAQVEDEACCRSER